MQDFSKRHKHVPFVRRFALCSITALRSEVTLSSVTDTCHFSRENSGHSARHSLAAMQTWEGTTAVRENSAFPLDALTGYLGRVVPPLPIKGPLRARQFSNGQRYVASLLPLLHLLGL